MAFDLSERVCQLVTIYLPLTLKDREVEIRNLKYSQQEGYITDLLVYWEYDGTPLAQYYTK